jgi:hypothetical protein
MTRFYLFCLVSWLGIGVNYGKDTAISWSHGARGLITSSLMMGLMMKLHLKIVYKKQ